MSLEQAQRDKLAIIAAKLRLEPGMRVLEIGSGWGGLACWLARHHGVDVTGLTLSREQLGHARARAAREGLANRVRFENLDYREATGTYDRVVSIAMFEAVGRPNYGAFFRQFHDRMVPDGLGLLHTIGRVFGAGGTDAFTARYIFPGGYCPRFPKSCPISSANGCGCRIWRYGACTTCTRSRPGMIAASRRKRGSWR